VEQTEAEQQKLKGKKSWTGKGSSKEELLKNTHNERVVTGTGE
jgi:hypothetical protein